MAYLPAIIAKKERARYRKWKLAQPDGNEFMNILRYTNILENCPNRNILLHSRLLSKKYILDNKNFAWNFYITDLLTGEELDEIYESNLEHKPIDPVLDIRHIYHIGLLCQLPMSERLILKYFDNMFWDEQSRVVDLEIVDRHKDWPWDWGEISANPNMTDEFLLKYLPDNKDWDWESLSTGHCISTQFVISRPDLPWEYGHDYTEFDFSVEYIAAHPNIVFNYDYLVTLSNEHFDYITTHHLDSLSMGVLSAHAPVDYIEQHQELEWDWARVGINTNITGLFLEGNEHRMSMTVVANPVFQVDGLIKTLGPKCIEAIGFNPNLKYTDIINHPEIKWDLEQICRNDFICNNYVCDKSIKKDSIKKRRYILKKAIGWVPDLAEIVASYCGYL
jgi:hypothetical protein